MSCSRTSGSAASDYKTRRKDKVSCKLAIVDPCPHNHTRTVISVLPYISPLFRFGVQHLTGPRTFLALTLPIGSILLMI